MTPMIPPAKRFAPGGRVYVQAQQVWLILVAFVMRRQIGDPETITYGDLALKMGYSTRKAAIMLGRPLGIIAEYCRINQLSMLNTIVVDTTGVPGSGVILSKGHTLRQDQADVYKMDWFSVRVPTTGTFRKVWEAFFSES
ncbi:MAG TPA: hypothetical protein VN808_09390 [Stellaceae bacterium]|nr:hypothetical protein [Stellaceae bacterium]